MSRHLFLVIPPLLAAVWQLFMMFYHHDALLIRTISALVIAASTFFYFRAIERKGSLNFFLRLIISLAICLISWLSALEILLRRTNLMALGSVGFLLLFLIGSLFYFWTISSRVAKGRLDHFVVEGALTLVMFCIVFILIEGGYKFFNPVIFHAPVPDEPGMGNHLSVNQQGLLMGNPKFRGKFTHPEFAGIPVQINDFGLRDGLDEATPPDSAEKSILILGDSFVYGLGVKLEDTFQEQAEDKLVQAGFENLRIYGGGIPGMGVHREGKIFEWLLPLTKPDIVVLAVFEGNDFMDTWYLVKGAGRNRLQQPEKKSELVGVLGHYLIGVATYNYWLGSSASILRLQKSISTALLNAGLLDFVKTDYFLDEYLRIDPPELVGESVQVCIDEILNIESRCKELQLPFIVMVIPAPVQADTEYYDEFLALRRKALRESYSRVDFHQKFITKLRKADLTVIDLLPALAAKSDSGQKCYHREGHWNATGHAVTAEQLTPVLQGLIEGGNPSKL